MRSSNISARSHRFWIGIGHVQVYARVGMGLEGIKLVSGGQTGADRAALDFAIEHGIPHGGWCPRVRKAEDGTIDARSATNY